MKATLPSRRAGSAGRSMLEWKLHSFWKKASPTDFKQAYSVDLTSRQFQRFCDLIYQACGIRLHEGKQQLLQARLSKRLRSTGIVSIDEYFRVLTREPQELTFFVDAVSTNHTFFFRESHHFEHLTAEHQLIWCAAASSGEEPYSVAIHCLEKGFRPAILATDISTRVIRIGQSGIYSFEKTQKLPPPILRRYFQRGIGEWSRHVKLKADIKQMVTYRRLNLLSDPVPGSDFDVVFCRNVLIYFDNPVKTQVIDKLFGALRPEGLLIIGGAESLNMISHPFKYVRPSVYLKAA